MTPGKLYVVGTPIGNLGDMSPRGVQALRDCDFIAAEDTRVTVKLLNHFEIKKEMLSYYEHNKSSKGGFIIRRILDGESCALVSDAGMPVISDPGENLVRAARESGIEVVSVPGPSALATALAVSGLPAGRFCFEGFLSVNKINRLKHLSELKKEKRTMIFYEAPHKLLNTLKDMLAAFGERDIAIARELTKIHESVKITTFSEALEYYTQTPPKGEFVLIVTGAPEAEESYTMDDAVRIARQLLEKGNSASYAAKEAAVITGYKKGDIYKLILE